MMYEHVDPDRLSRLVSDLVGDVPSCLRFVDDFLGAWGGRIARVQGAVGAFDVEDALAALLSLASSSTMVGAGPLGAAAQDLYDEASLSGFLSPQGTDRLERLGAGTCTELVHLTARMRPAA